MQGLQSNHNHQAAGEEDWCESWREGGGGGRGGAACGSDGGARVGIRGW